tara:strand:+ start:247687 stop:248310 length:624 start_codon:yes stop_codon:yes gene_type:complete
MKHSDEERTLALAGIAQAATLVHEIASHGDCNQQAYKASIESIFRQESDSTLGVFGDIENLHVGFAELQKILSSDKEAKSSQEVMRYFLGLLVLERKLNKKAGMLTDIGNRIDKAQRQAEYFDDTTHTSVVANLADSYVETLGSFAFRIMVTGNQQYLHQEDLLAKIRSLLLAGIRATVLWRQLGGTKFHIIFGRKKILNCINVLQA